MNGNNKLMNILLCILILVIIVTNVFYMIKMHNMNTTNQRLNKQLNQLILSENNKLQQSIQDKKKRIDVIYQRLALINLNINSLAKPQYTVLSDTTLSIENQQRFIKEYDK